jgi:hypothetical protein
MQPLEGLIRPGLVTGTHSTDEAPVRSSERRRRGVGHAGNGKLHFQGVARIDRHTGALRGFEAHVVNGGQRRSLERGAATRIDDHDLVRFTLRVDHHVEHDPAFPAIALFLERIKVAARPAANLHTLEDFDLDGRDGRRWRLRRTHARHEKQPEKYARMILVSHDPWRRNVT